MQKQNMNLPSEAGLFNIIKWHFFCVKTIRGWCKNCNYVYVFYYITCIRWPTAQTRDFWQQQNKEHLSFLSEAPHVWLHRISKLCCQSDPWFPLKLYFLDILGPNLVTLFGILWSGNWGNHKCLCLITYHTYHTLNEATWSFLKIDYTHVCVYTKTFIVIKMHRKSKFL